MPNVPDIAGDFAQIVAGLSDVSVASGNSGSVKIGATLVAEVTRWTFDCRVHTVRFAASDSAGFAHTTAGTKEGTGTLEGYRASRSRLFFRMPGKKRDIATIRLIGIRKRTHYPR